MSCFLTPGNVAAALAFPPDCQSNHEASLRAGVEWPYRPRLATMRFGMRWMVLAGVVALAGCAGQQVTAANPCVVNQQVFSDDGSETPLQMQVAKNADKCVVFVARVVGDPQSMRGRVISPPTHGTAEGFAEPTGLNVRGVGMATGLGVPPNAQQIALGAVYRPAPGFVGKDEFRFAVNPVRRGTFRVQVEVTEPKL